MTTVDLLTALRILARQWPVVVIGLVLTVVGVVQVGAMVAPQYEAKGTVLLLSPGAGVNPYLEFPAGLEVTADALVVGLQTESGVEQAEAAGATGVYTLERTTGPLVDITAHAGSDAEATATVDAVVERMRAELGRYQVDSAADQQITVEVLSAPTATAKLGSRIRAQAAVFAVGLVATVSAGMAVDAFRRQRREARARRDGAVDPDVQAEDASSAPTTVRPSRSWQAPIEPERAPVARGPVRNGSATGRPSQRDVPEPVANGRARSDAYAGPPARNRPAPSRGNQRTAVSPTRPSRP